MKIVRQPWILGFIIFVAMIWVASCASTNTSSSWGSGEIPNVGVYPPAPAGFQKYRLAVIYFEDKASDKRRAEAAADQITTLLVKTHRFQMIERERIKNILKEQHMEGIVREDQLPKTGQMLGVEYLCYGSVTDFEVKKTETKAGTGFLNRIVPGISAFEIDFSKGQLDFHIGVDIRIVDTTTGEILFAESADVKRTETVEGMGLNVLGFSTSSGGKIEIDSENQGRLLRLALDMVIKKLLPEIDKKFTKTGQ
jgi:curli biogenesis system outer membrane secretion channel CsgG